MVTAHERGEYSHEGRGAAGGVAEVLEEHTVLVLHRLQPLGVAVLNGLAAIVVGGVCGVGSVAHGGDDGVDDGDDGEVLSVVLDDVNELVRDGRTSEGSVSRRRSLN